jgi:hypothetical protein
MFVLASKDEDAHVMTEGERTVASPPRREDGAKRGVLPWYALGAALLFRAADHGIFAIWVVTSRPEWARLFDVGALYGFVDGTIALITVVLLVRSMPSGAPRLLSAMTFADGVGRLATSAALVAFPGISTGLITTVSLFGAVGAAVGALGVIAMTVWLIARLRAGRSWRVASDALFDPLAVAALVSFIVAYTLFANPPATSDGLRTVAVGVSGVLAGVFFIASWGAVHTATRLESVRAA